ncbi:MAG: OsmC family peroxiredoxin [Anaerolineae bacterium]|nr:OsmC family peroxiredoxin [Anaerolineae bacterium]
MANIERNASAVWHGTLREGNGKMSTGSGVLREVPYTFATRFEQSPGTNPEELLAAAHAACYSMALSAALARKEYTVHHIQTTATCVMESQPTGGFKITTMRLVTRAKVDDVSPDAFQTIAEETKKTCPVSGALAALNFELDAALE